MIPAGRQYPPAGETPSAASEDARELKLRILAQGIRITSRARAWLAERVGTRLSAFDYASTSGVILELDGDVWVNAPIADHNHNFVVDTRITLDLDVASGTLFIEGYGATTEARYCLQPAYQQSSRPDAGAAGSTITHGDRVRLSPLRGCSMVCTFCNIPYDFPISTYSLEPICSCIQSLRSAVSDPVQPARHIMISGGTPKPKDYPHYQELYRRILEEFPAIPVDIMMVPDERILRLQELRSLGVSELSINLEVYDRVIAREVARGKYGKSRAGYLGFIERASDVIGPGRIRSMLMVGLEPSESTLRGVGEIAKRGGVPVLSPFRPDPATPLRNRRPPTYEQMRDILSQSQEIVARYNTVLGPTCPPCTHNTIGFAEDGAGVVRYRHPRPKMLLKY
jgi:Radical SAM superfamily